MSQTNNLMQNGPSSNSQSLNSNSPTRVVITGLGAITPLGLDVDTTWEGLLAGRSGIDHITRFDTSELRTTFAGEVRDFKPTDYIERKEARRLDTYIQYAMAATKEALADSKLDLEVEEPNRMGVISNPMPMACALQTKRG